MEKLWIESLGRHVTITAEQRALYLADFTFPRGGGLLGTSARSLAIAVHLREKVEANERAKRRR